MVLIERIRMRQLSSSKGQFFILSAVVIAMILFALAQGLEGDKSIIPGTSQEIDLFSLTSSIHQGINKTISSSSASTLEGNLQLYLANKQEALEGEGVVFTYTYDIVGSTAQVNATLDTASFNINLNYP